MSFFCRPLTLRFFRSIEIDFLSNFDDFFDVIVWRCWLILISIVIVIVITVVNVNAVILLSAVPNQEELTSATINGASRGAWLDLLLLFRFRSLGSAILSWGASYVFGAWVGLARVAYPAASFGLWVKLQVLSILVVVGGVDDGRVLAHESTAVVQVFKTV